MKILVSKNKRLYIDDEFIVEGENKADKLEFEFPSELENFVKFIVISSDEGDYIDLILNNEYIITRAISNLHNISIAVICTNSEIVSELTKIEDLTDIENEIEFRSLSIELPTIDFLVDLDTVENDDKPSAIARVYKKVLKNTEDINTIKENQDNLKQNFENLETLKNEVVQATESMQDLTEDIQNKLENGEFNGKDGLNGQDGRDGAKGDKGDKGEQGIQGLKGETGEKGDTGEKGNDGYTPRKGVDYYTDEDKAEIIKEIQDNIQVQNETETLIKNMIFNTIEGENIDIDDAHSYDKNSLKIYGNIKQEPVPDPTFLSEVQTVKENIHFYKNNESYDLTVQKEMFTGDYFTKDEEVHSWKEIVLTGNEPGFNMEEWETSLTNVYSFRMHLGSGLIKGTKVCSNYFEEKEVLFNKDITGMKCAENSSVDFHIQKELLKDGTIQSFKNWLKQKHDEGNPVIVYYKSSEEEKLLLTEEQKTVINNLYNNFELIEGINHIYSNDEVSPIFKLEYMQSNKILNQKMNEKIKNIESRLSLLE